MLRAHKVAEKLAMSLPERDGRRLFQFAAWVAWRFAKGPRATVGENLARVLGRPVDSPVVRAASREAFRSYARYWHETFLGRALDPQDFLKRFTITGREHVDEALEAGGGCILAIPHLGNWDLAGYFMALNGYRLTAVAEELKPPELYELFVRHREALGMGIVGLSDARKVGEELVRLLSTNEILALVADRDIKGKGVPVEMFGATRRLPPGPALLSLATGTPLLPAWCRDTEDGWEILISPPLEIERSGEMRRDVGELTRRLAGHFERAIAAVPTQWHVFQPAWPKEEGSPEAS